MVYWIGLAGMGAVFGVCIGLLTDDIAVWAAIGLTFGIAVGAAIRAHDHD